MTAEATRRKSKPRAPGAESSAPLCHALLGVVFCTRRRARTGGSSAELRGPSLACCRSLWERVERFKDQLETWLEAELGQLAPEEGRDEVAAEVFELLGLEGHALLRIAPLCIAMPLCSF
ncbi:unnamed protein product [Symbiodinium necroappetens]|uniref:Uncharacterized protein n=1 Tax=Symbiodinium necroappetens TaxID=1628268 RepID=A0A813CJ72_9DINO|nr:unnamed protein product [Symbiodinium necroappetens]